jgi:FkbM family methyltransferase
MTSALTNAALTLGRSYVRHAPGTLGKRALLRGYLNAGLRDHPRQVVSRTRFGAVLAIDTQDLIQRYIHLFGVWEPHMTAWLQRRLRPGDGFIDVGANIGYYSLLASRLVGPTGNVVAIEASPDFDRILRENTRLNACVNVRPANVAASDRDHELTFVLASSKNMGANSIVPYAGPAESTFVVTAHPLPDILTDEEIAQARVIKVDVEGAEGGVVRGLVPMLDRLRPDAELTVEVTPDRMAQLGDSVDELMATMAEHGFHAYRLANDYDPGSYPAAIRHPKPPVRWRGPVTEESDLVFSRVDEETLG